MKKLLVLFYLVGLIIAPSSMAAKSSVKLAEAPTPSDYNIPQSSSETIVQLKKLLGEGKQEEFYMEARKIFNRLNSKAIRDLSAEEFYERMWIYYYFADAPLFAKNITPDFQFTIAYDGKRDIEVKFDVGKHLYMMSYITELHDEKFFNKKDMGTLSARYFANMLFMLKNYCDPSAPQTMEKLASDHKKKTIDAFLSKWKDWDKKNRENTRDKELTTEEYVRLKEESEKHTQDAYDMRNEINMFKYKCVMVERRCEEAQKAVDELEKQFVETLVNYFPEKAREVRKYIKMAGYADDETNDLINRTVGRDSSTEFLYKNRKNKDNKKRKQPTQPINLTRA